MPLFAGIELPHRPDPENIRRLDVLPIPMIRSMQRYGFAIDVEHFRALSSRLNARMTELRRDITNQIPAESLDRFVEIADVIEADPEDEDTLLEVARPEFNADSPKKMAELLYDVLSLHLRTDTKIKRTKSGGLNTGKKTLEQLKREHPVVALVLEYRENSKLDGTYAKAMPRQARRHPKGPDCPLCGWHHHTEEIRVHSQIMTTRTQTGRTAHKSPNLANIPVKTTLGREILAGFVASTGCVIVARDLAGIELRLLAWLSGDQVMIEVFRTGGDLHNNTACGAFGLKPEEIDPIIHRIPSKTANFSIVYGTTEMGLYEQLCVSFAVMKMAQPDWLTEAWCKWFIDKWFQTYPGAKLYLDSLESTARRFAITWTPCGRVRRIPEVRSCHSYIQEAGVRQAANHPIQGASADLMKLIMAETWTKLLVLEQYGIRVRPINTIYDALMIESEEDDGDTINATVEEVMGNVLVDRETGKSECTVPIKSDGKIGKRWEK